MSDEVNLLLQVSDLKKHFTIKGGLLRKDMGAIRAVDDVDLVIRKGETFGLVGESGCGKTTLGRVILRLTDATEGEIFFEKTKLLELKKDKMQKMRRNMQMVFQDPHSSLDPRMSVKRIVSEPILIHGTAKGRELRKRIMELLEKVGLSPDHADRFPHEFSGGQRQRIGVARAIALNPSFIVLDEPTSSLDVSVQAKILNLLKDLQKELGLTYLFISHDLSVIKHMCDRIAVMYVGKIVEVADKDDLFKEPLHPYTKALFSAVPIPDPHLKDREKIILRGEVASPINPPPGCRFHPRCQHLKDMCKQEEPPLIEVGDGHYVACHHVSNYDSYNIALY